MKKIVAAIWLVVSLCILTHAAFAQKQEPAAAQSSEGGAEQYAANKLRLAEAHKVARPAALHAGASVLPSALQHVGEQAAAEPHLADVALRQPAGSELPNIGCKHTRKDGAIDVPSPAFPAVRDFAPENRKSAGGSRPEAVAV